MKTIQKMSYAKTDENDRPIVDVVINSATVIEQYLIFVVIIIVLHLEEMLKKCNIFLFEINISLSIRTLYK